MFYQVEVYLGKCTTRNSFSLVSKWIQSPLFGKQLDKSLQCGVWLQKQQAALMDAELLMHRSRCLRARRPAKISLNTIVGLEQTKPESMRSGLRREQWGVFSPVPAPIALQIVFICPLRDSNCSALARERSAGAPSRQGNAGKSWSKEANCVYHWG